MSAPLYIIGVQRDPLLPVFAEVAAHHPCLMVRRPEQLTVALIEAVRPAKVFLPDWSWIVGDDILARAECIGFHAAPLPDYRGGSPLQHQILDGKSETLLSCFRMQAGLDSGAILLQRPLSLAGSIGEIWQRSAGLLPEMILAVIAGCFSERPQGPGGFTRRRRKPEESRLPGLAWPLDKLYDFIRMLDDPYPNAFLDIDGKRLRLRKASLADGRLVAEVVIEAAP
jgi:methionyl-tRNA formyltransferase